MNEVTIKDLAKDLGVSKTTISKAVESCGLYGKLKKIGNRFVLTEEQILQIKMQISPSLQSLQSSQSLQKSQISQSLQTEEQLKQKPQESQSSQISQTEEYLASSMTLLEQQISILQQQLKVKDNQISLMQQQIGELSKSLNHTTEALKAAQALHAGTIQQQLNDSG